MNFNQWIDLVDEEVSLLSDISIHDLPYMNFMDLFEAGEPAEQVAQDALIDAGFIA